ncbi:hypothetical protein Ahy_B03g064077 [Arachis hypogaea]|uniref:Uncharacterized protein n=1 Tax=Arachis hypogaea TaxID=3818 RepID=A0A444ZYN5_ARAHY|nr:hypothetical protein Ahy_B03g064077 [Arachis hypogaea]
MTPGDALRPAARAGLDGNSRDQRRQKSGERGENKFAVRSGAKTSGDLPQFESCKSISIIDLDKNNLSGTILNSFSKCQALEKLNLSNNNMIGHIPEELARNSFKLMGSNAFVGNSELCGAPL